jgi:hypothetical protein
VWAGTAAWDQARAFISVLRDPAAHEVWRAAGFEVGM